MKAHKYWSLGALACMAGCFYTGCKKLMQAHKYFACGSLVCMGMAIYSGHKIAPKKKKNWKIRTHALAVTSEGFSELQEFILFPSQTIHYIPYTSIMSRIPTFRPSSKAVFSHAQHTVPCRSVIFSQRGILSSPLSRPAHQSSQTDRTSRKYKSHPGYHLELSGGPLLPL